MYILGSKIFVHLGLYSVIHMCFIIFLTDLKVVGNEK
jgi:hypothetical protein